MTRYHRKVDANQPILVEFLRKMGYSVVSLASVGQGVPDLLAGKWGKTYLFEIKIPAKGGKLTEDQEKFFTSWKGSYHIITSPEDILEFDRKHSAFVSHG